MDNWCTEWATADEIRNWRKVPKLAQAQEYVGCLECGRKVFRQTQLQTHLKGVHGWTLEQYHKRYPGAPTGSLELRRKQKEITKKRYHQAKQTLAEQGQLVLDLQTQNEQALAEKEKELATLRAQVDAEKKKLAELEKELAAAEEAKAGQEDKIAAAVNDAIPRFERLFSTPGIKQNPKLLLGDWRHPDFNWDEIRAAREAYMGRAARRQWPTLAARWFVALTMNYDIATVRRYHNRQQRDAA
jgi:hypothetical protein